MNKKALEQQAAQIYREIQAHKYMKMDTREKYRLEQLKTVYWHIINRLSKLK